MISVALIVKNEETELADCLETVKDADEIVICDTGSTDKTIKIAKKYTDKVFTDYKWNDHFGEAYTHAFSKCTQDWILSIDADGRLEKGGIKKLRNVLKNLDPMYDSVSYFIKNKNGRSHTLPRICKKGTKWQYRVHSNPLVEKTFKSDIEITAGYSKAHKKDPDRALRMLKLQHEELPDDARTLYYLAREYWYRKDLITAVYWWERYVKVSQFLAEKADAHLFLARCYWHLRQGEKARQNCLQAININSDFKEALEFMAEISWEHNAKNWREFAKVAKNERVLFVRSQLKAVDMKILKLNEN